MWEVLEEGQSKQTERMPVPGGWLYRTYTYNGRSLAMVFVPDGSVNLQASQMLNEFVDNARSAETSQLS